MQNTAKPGAFHHFSRVSFSTMATSCLIKHLSKSRSCCHHWPFLFLSAMAGCEDATQRAIRAWSAPLSCHVASAAPFVLINCPEKCVTSCQADCWCPSGHPPVPGARRCYCGSGGCGGEDSRALQDVGQYWEGRGGNPGAVCRSRVRRVSLRALPRDLSPEDRLCHPLTSCVWGEYQEPFMVFLILRSCLLFV